MSILSRMYARAKTWNPLKGCLFNCPYCRPSFQRQAKRQKQCCVKCYSYKATLSSGTAEPDTQRQDRVRLREG